MEVIENVLFIIFLSTCLCLTCYQTYVQLNEYVKNEDTASIEYRKFNLEEKDQYPTFSICFAGKPGETFDESHPSFTNHNITPSLYGSFLLGNEDDDPKYDQIVYDDVISNIIHNYVIGLERYGFNGSDIYRSTYDVARENQDKFSVSTTFQLPISGYRFTTCVSKKVSYQKNMAQLFDALYFNATSLSKKNLVMTVFVHQVGQVKQSLIATPLVEIQTNNVKNMKQVYEYSVNNVEVLRKRHDSKVSCDENLLDETQMALDTVMRKVECIPAYWKIFADKLLHLLPKCKQNQYRTINKYYTSTAFKTVEAMYTQPCSSMTLSTTYNPGSGDSEDKSILISLWFNYVQGYYKEILNKRAYTSGNLLGQVGGYVGMFLGFSLFQVTHWMTAAGLSLVRYMKRIWKVKHHTNPIREQEVELNQSQVISASPEGGRDDNFREHLTSSRVPLVRRNDNANKPNQINDHELDMIMEKLDSRINERIEAKILAALETYFSNSQTRKLPRKRY